VIIADAHSSGVEVRTVAVNPSAADWKAEKVKR
jgi:hypothetical protein